MFSSSDILALCQYELRADHTAVAVIAGDESAVIGLLRICYIIDNLVDSSALSSTLTDMPRYDACGCH